MSRALEVVGSVSRFGDLPNYSAVSSAADGFPCGMSHDAAEPLFWNLVMPIVQTVTRPSTSHLPPCLVDPTAFLSETLCHFTPVAKFWPEPGPPRRRLREELRLLLFDLGACADGYTAMEDTETTLTRVFDRAGY